MKSRSHAVDGMGFERCITVGSVLPLEWSMMTS
jgi:hypothetical protein